MARGSFIVLLAICLFAMYLESADTQFVSHYCPKDYYVRVKKSYTRNVKCGCWGWYRCRRRFYYTTIEKRTNTRACCGGWRSCYCNVPVCTRGCGNGICVAPNQCYCDSGSGGTECQYRSCNFATDCYPGTCYGTNSCKCPASYTGSNCLTVREPPDMESCNAKLYDGNTVTFAERCGDVNYDNHTYYTNARRISRVELDWRSKYDHFSKEGVVEKPSYLLSANLGVVSAYSDVALYTAVGNVEYNGRVECGIVNLTENNPHINAECLRRDINWDDAINHNYKLQIDMYTESGGYKDKRNPQGGYLKDWFGTALFNMSIHITFDLQDPVHCLEANDCESVFQFPVVIYEDITRLKSLEITWTGWIDDDSDIDYYEYTIYNMALNQENLLEEQWATPVTQKTKWDDLDESLKPSDETEDIENFFPLFTPDRPGMYSIILDVLDRAGNKGKARTLVLFDDTHGVDITEGQIEIEGVSMNEAGLWIGTIQSQSEEDGSNDLTISWKNHFSNKFHHEHKLLNPCKPLYNTPGGTTEEQQQDATKNAIYDDNYGNLTTVGFPNSNGIIKYTVLVEVDHLAHPLVSTGINESVSLKIVRGDKNIVKVTIEATDILGNTKDDTIQAVVDSSPPMILERSFQKDNSPGIGNGIVFGSQIEINVFDHESGLKEIQFDIVNEESGRRKRDTTGYTQEPQILDPSNEACVSVIDSTCYCTNHDAVCYKRPQILYINHCWLIAEPERQQFAVVYSVVNNGGAKTSEQVTIGYPAGLNGIGTYQAIALVNLNVSKIHGKGAEVNWVFPYSCYEVEGVRIVVQNHVGASVKELVLREKVNGKLIEDLQPKTSYRVEAFVRYYNPQGGDELESVTSGWVEFNTGEGGPPPPGVHQGISEGAIVGIVFGVIILLLIAAIGIFILIRVSRHQKPVPEYVSHMHTNIRNRLSTHFTRHPMDVETPKMKQNGAYGNPGYAGHQEVDDDVYVYGNMDTDVHASWKINPDRVIIKHALPNAKGRFANLCVANLIDKNGKIEVVAKMLKEGYTEDEKLLMKAKMNFFATEELQHENVVRFLGACVEEPILLFEYCAGGTLSDWLKSQSSVTGDVEEQFSSFAMSIARGVVYLHSKKVIHKRMGARNILLKENMGRLSPKLYGFGPLRGESDEKSDEAGQGKKEKIPIKWMAPEQFEKASGKPRVYSKATDVWGYGIVLWEMYSKGEGPYPEMSSSQVKAWLLKKNRLAKPRYAPDFLYSEVMLKTWKTKPKDRPSMDNIHATLRKHFEGVGDGDEYYYEENGASGDGQAKPDYGLNNYSKQNNKTGSEVYDDTM